MYSKHLALGVGYSEEFGILNDLTLRCVEKKTGRYENNHYTSGVGKSTKEVCFLSFPCANK